MTTINDLDDFKALEPFFRIIERDSTASPMARTSSTCWPKTSSLTSSSPLLATRGTSRAARPSQSYTAPTAT